MSSLSGGQHKCHTKRWLKFKNNAVGCTTFESGWHVIWDHGMSLTYVFFI